MISGEFQLTAPPPLSAKFWKNKGAVNSFPLFPIEKKGILYRTKGSFEGTFFLDLTVAIQDWVDTGVSNEIGVNPELFSMVEFSDKALEYMLQGRMKTIYYMSETSCTSCSN